MTLKFKEWEELNEANIFDKVKTWFNINFGGALSKIENLISEWGPDAPQWRTFLKSVGENGYPKGYQPGSMVDHKELFPRLDEEGLSVGFSFNMENSELKDLLKGL